MGISIADMLWSLGVAFLMGLFILLVYKQTFRGVLFSKGYAFSLVLLAMVTALVIRTISSNLALSLGMVGALSIVRFRTAIKDPVDTVFMFWSITCGIMAGAGQYIIGGCACFGVGLLYFVVSKIHGKSKAPYLLGGAVRPGEIRQRGQGAQAAAQASAEITHHDKSRRGNHAGGVPQGGRDGRARQDAVRGRRDGCEPHSYEGEFGL